MVYYKKEYDGHSLIVPGGIPGSSSSYADRTHTWSLDGPYLQQKWVLRNENAQFRITGSLLIAIGWLLFTCPILQLSYVLSNGGKRRLGLHSTMACLALIASCTEFFSTLFKIGTYRAASFMVDRQNLRVWVGTDDDYMGYKVLEMTFRSLEATNLWVDAFEYLALFGIFSMYFVSLRNVQDNLFHTLGMRLGGMGLFIGLFSLVDFALLLLRLLDWGAFSPLTMVFSHLNRFFLLPVWLLVMSFRLPKATQIATGEANRSKQPVIGSESAVLS